MKLPFGWMPGHWGLEGKTREIARAEYELTGYERELKVTELKYEDDPKVCEGKLLKVKRKHNKINQYDYEILDAENTLEGVDLEVRKIEIEHKYGKLDDQQAVKLIATARKEPYIAVINSTYDPSLKLDGFEFEFDWNHLWIEQLIAAGYSGLTEELIVQRWFEDLCRTVVLESADQEPIPFNSRRTANRVPHAGGPTDYS
jgi:hypothetical protein